MDVKRPVAALTVALLATGLSACSGSGSGTGSTAGPTVVVQSPEASGPSDPKGQCDKAAFAGHAGLMLGTVDTYLWKPFVAGSFTAGAKDRAKAMTAAAGASALAAREMTAAGPLVAGCPGSIILVNALTTGSSLAKAASTQFGKGAPNPQTVAGVNSIASTVAGQATKIGVAVKPTNPTAAQLAAKS